MNLTMFDRPRYYVSLGDSMSIDAYAGGPGKGAASLLLKNRDEDFPDWQGKDLQTALPGARLIPLAADAATTATVRYVHIPQLKEMKIRPDIITLTIGGNDLVQTFGSESATRDAYRNVQENVGWTLRELRKMAGSKVPVLVGTIYDPSDGTGDGAALNLGAWTSALTWLGRFNDTLKQLAAEHDCQVADINAHFLGHGLSVGDPTRHEPRPENRELWYCGIIEPNAWGASAIRALWWETLVATGTIMA
jgi:lysophospholipase L1-like esterase